MGLFLGTVDYYFRNNVMNWKNKIKQLGSVLFLIPHGTFAKQGDKFI